MTLAFGQIILFFVLLALSALFACAEIAYTGLSLSQLKRLRKSHPGVFEFWERSPDKVLATLLLSNNAVNTAVGVITASLSFHFAEVFGLRQSVVTVLFGFFSGTILLLFGEIFPKIVARRFTLPMAFFVTPIIRRWVQIVSPISHAIVSMTHVLLGARGRSVRSPFLTRGELKRMLMSAQLPSSSRTLISQVIDFEHARVADVMRRREDIFAIPVTQPLNKIIQSVIQSGLSRIPIYSGSLDNVLGIIYAKDLLLAWRTGSLVLVQDLIRPVQHVRMDMPLTEALRLFRTGRQHLSLVKDPETGRVQGLITLQDSLEPIFGEIRQED